MPILNINTNHLCFADSESVTTNPRKRFFDFTTNLNGIKVRRPESDDGVLAPGETQTLFSGVRSLTIDNSSTFDLSLSSILPSTYRLTCVSGTAPSFRVARAVTMNGEEIGIIINNNATVDFTLDEFSSNTFVAIQVGDVVFIPGPTTGDSASPFSDINQGFWTVLAKGAVGSGANRKLTMKRPGGDIFQATDENVIVTANSQFQAFSSGAVQIGDSLRISSGFSSVTLQTYQISKVTSSWVEFFSSEPLPLESGIVPTASGISIYSDARDFIRLEVDQNAVVRLNGDPNDFNTISPMVTSDSERVGYFEKWGAIWSLVLVNQNQGSALNFRLLAATLDQ